MTDRSRPAWRSHEERVLAAYRAGVVVAGVLPPGVGRALAEGLGRLAARVPPPRGAGTPWWRGLAARQAMVARHARRVEPGLSGRALDRQVGQVFASYARYWAESLRLPNVSPAEVQAGMSLEGFEHLDAALAAGRGAVLALPHLGGWEWGGVFLAGAGVATSVVVEDLGERRIGAWFASFRSRLGMEVIAAGPGAAEACAHALAANRVLCLLCDRRVPGVAGVEVDFFGERTALPAGPVALALRGGAPLLPAAVYFGRGAADHVAVVRPPVPLGRRGRFRDDVRAGTQQLAEALEALIRRAPSQWHLVQPNWPSDQAPGGPAAPLPDGPAAAGPVHGGRPA